MRLCQLEANKTTPKTNRVASLGSEWSIQVEWNKSDLAAPTNNRMDTIASQVIVLLNAPLASGLVDQFTKFP